jgi:probable F420-dependent oxidoreductase
MLTVGHAQAQTARGVKLGVMPSLVEGSLNGRTPRYKDMEAIAQRAEQLGFDSLWLADHLIFRRPDAQEIGPWEIFTFLSALAAVTHRITLGPLVAATSFRNPALLAKMADSLDEISNGRFILGLGAGWHEPEYQAFGYPFDHLYTRFAEALDIISRLLQGERVTHTGTFYQTHETFLRPRGPSRSGPPIWIGASGPKMLELAARYADGFNTVWHTDPQEVRERLAAFDAACEKVGRDPGALEHTIGTDVRMLEGDEQPENPAQRVIEGTAEQVAERLREIVAAGAQHIIAHVEPRGLVGIERYARVRQILAREGLEA